jgi:hypothetical protein
MRVIGLPDIPSAAPSFLVQYGGRSAARLHAD